MDEDKNETEASGWQAERRYDAVRLVREAHHGYGYAWAFYGLPEETEGLRERMMTISTNDTVTVELTEAGVKAMAKYRVDMRAKLLRMGMPESAIKWPNDPTSESMTLWELMVIFGSSMHQGCNIPFVNNQITLIEDEAVTVSTGSAELDWYRKFRSKPIGTTEIRADEFGGYRVTRNGRMQHSFLSKEVAVIAFMGMIEDRCE